VGCCIPEATGSRRRPVKAPNVVDEPSAVVEVEEPSVVVATVVTVVSEVVEGAWLSLLTARTITPARKTIEKSPMMRPTRLSIECPRGIGAGV
jgi:hypothetical protein